METILPADRLTAVAEALDTLAERAGRYIASRIHTEVDEEGRTTLQVDIGIGVQYIEVIYKAGAEVPYTVAYCAYKAPEDDVESLLGTAVSPRMAAGLVWAALAEEEEQMRHLNAALASSEAQAQARDPR